MGQAIMVAMLFFGFAIGLLVFISSMVHLAENLGESHVFKPLKYYFDLIRNSDGVTVGQLLFILILTPSMVVWQIMAPVVYAVIVVLYCVGKLIVKAYLFINISKLLNMKISFRASIITYLAIVLGSVATLIAKLK